MPLSFAWCGAPEWHERRPDVHYSPESLLAVNTNKREAERERAGRLPIRWRWLVTLSLGRRQSSRRFASRSVSSSAYLLAVIGTVLRRNHGKHFRISRTTSHVPICVVSRRWVIKKCRFPKIIRFQNSAIIVRCLPFKNAFIYFFQVRISFTCVRSVATKHSNVNAKNWWRKATKQKQFRRNPSAIIRLSKE